MGDIHLRQWVLIETYWNVNTLCARSVLPPLLVLIETYWNVNLTSLNTSTKSTAGLNRNILECKWVLQRNRQRRTDIRLNRNILECKYLYINDPVLIDEVLIETYWNVNTVAGGVDYASSVVLIETYWNVNYCILLITFGVFNSLNRNILECKLKSLLRTSFPLSVLIETYWNVNLGCRRCWR